MCKSNKKFRENCKQWKKRDGFEELSNEVKGRKWKSRIENLFLTAFELWWWFSPFSFHVIPLRLRRLPFFKSSTAYFGRVIKCHLYCYLFDHFLVDFRCSSISFTLFSVEVRCQIFFSAPFNLFSLHKKLRFIKFIFNLSLSSID